MYTPAFTAAEVDMLHELVLMTIGSDWHKELAKFVSHDSDVVKDILRHARMKLISPPDLVEALRRCYTRIFNYNAGVDDIRDPEATKELNAEAMEIARAALRKANQ